MILVNRKKVAAVLCTALLATAGVVNYFQYNNSKMASLNLPLPDEKYEENTNYGEAKYVSSDINKEKSRSEAIALLKSVAESEDAPADKKAEAQAEIIRIAKDIEKEAVASDLLSKKGFSEVSVSVTADNATVSVKSQGLEAEEIAKIRDTMKNDAGIQPQNLKIIEIK